MAKTSKGMWIGIGAAVLALVVIASVYLAPAMALRKKVVIGTKDEVFYSGNATEQDARALGEALKGAGYFTDRGVSTTLAKESDWTTISFVIQDDAWKDPNNVAAFGLIGRMVAPVVGDLPIRVRLTGSNLRTQKELYID
ncbi:MAG: hypothetical protein M3081_12340 [Gemmatimonadota bacterium]|nr:hypothetical protein [Gemmatimonadota bacterium]